MQNSYLDALKKRVLVFDGAMGTMIQRYNLTEEDYGGKEGCNEYLVLTRPDVVEEIHTQYMEAGCDILETDSFTGSRLKLEEYGLGELTHKINVTAAQIARRVADRFATPERPRWVAGSLGPTGMLPSSNDPALSNITFNQLADIFEEQAIALIEGGADLLLIETSQDILEVKAAIHGIQRAFEKAGKRVPLQVQVTLDVSGRMLLGTDIAAVMTILEALPVDVIGLNCSTGPEHMREPIRFLGENSRLPISCIPNAGLPHNEGGIAVYPETPEEMVPQLAEFVTELGVSVVGGCCGTTPDHIRLLVKTVEGLVPKQRELVYQPRIASTIRAVTLKQEPPPLLVGERVNATGSRKVKRLLLSDNYDDIVAVARDQVESGAHALDVSVALTERPDEGYQMSQVVKRLGMSVEAPLVIDSTEADVVQQALELYGGRAIINSVNLENGRKRVDAIFPLAKIHGSAVVALTIDEEGMAKTADRKLEVARRIHDIAVDEYGLQADALIFDVQTFPLTTGQADLLDSALQTMEGIRKIKAALPGVFTLLGVSNLSFGIDPRARAVLNSVFLYHAVQAGLDLAIINPAHVTPYAEINEEERKLAEDLILNRTPDALAAYIQYWEGRAPDTDEKDAAVDPTEGMTTAQKIHWQILHRKKDNIENLIDQAVQNQDPVAVLNGVLLPAMKDVGDRFGAGELILPFVLQSAEVMKRAVAQLEKYLEKKEGYTKGRVVIATVFGDVHDIGKNLVNTILTNNGYTVYDLGKQVPVNKIIDKAIEVDATAIGLSALLVSTSKQMPNVVQELAKRGLAYPVIIGGAAINRPYGQRIMFVEPDLPYAPGVFYAKDAFEGLEIMDTLTGDAAARERFVQHTIEAAREAQRKEQERLAAAPAPKPQPARSAVKEAPVPKPPFWGVRVLGPAEIDMREVFNHLPLKDLFFLSWGGSAMKGADRERLLEEDFRPRLRRMQDEVIANGTLTPRAVYGYFPCQATGDELIVYDPKLYEATGEKREVTRFGFARQPDGERLCLADYFASVDSGRVDVLELQVVTMGEKASQLADALQKAGDYTEAYFLHGLSVQSAEALADWLHNRARLELGLPAEQGKRYSWGYAACPDTSEHSKLYKLMPVTEATGVELTESCQFVPEQTTAAMVVHHPEAKYYSTISRPFLNVTGDVE